MFRISLLALALAGTTVSAQSIDDVVATVNGKDITLGEVLITKMQLPPQYQQIPDDVLMTGVIDQIVQQQLLADSLETEPKRTAIAVTNEVRSIRAGEAISQLTETPPTDAEIQAAYEEQFVNVEAQKEYNASHILVETEEAAQALIERLNNGEDFAELAKTESTGPSGPSGGELGWFGPGMMVEPFQVAVAEMEPGAISAPVQTQFGWHVIKLNEVRDQSAPALEEVKGMIADDLIRQRIEARIAELESSAVVTRVEGLDPALIQRSELLDQ